MVAVLLAAFAIQGALSATRDSATYDETAHIAAGLSYLETFDFRLNPEHPPLAKMWAAIPLALEPGRQISTTSRNWSNTRQWEIGYEYLNGPTGTRPRLDPARRLMPARFAMVVLGLLLLLVVYVWSRELWGPAGAQVTLVFGAFSPTILAHTRLVTTDVPAALGISATLWLWWRFTQAPSLPRAVWVGAACGTASVMKYASLMLAPVLVALALVWVTRGRHSSRGARARWATVAGVVVVAAVLASVWACYGFRYGATHDGSALTWELTQLEHGRASEAIQFLKDWRALPEAFLYGLAYLAGHATGRDTYLNGVVHPEGSWLFFPETFLLKTTPALLVACVWLIVRAARTRRLDEGVLAVTVPLALLFAMDVGSAFNIGHRHLVPLYPLLFVLAGGLVQSAGTLASGTGVALVLVSQIASSVTTFPQDLSYFNILAGGSSGGARYLSDSNIDWGQDLPRLKTWIDLHQVESIDLVYFGTADPAAYGIRYRSVYRVYDFDGDTARVEPQPGGYVAVSTTLLHGLYVTDPDVAAFLARVRSTLRPVGRAGDSILIYRLPRE